MNIELLADIIQEFYYSGRVKSDRKLKREDFVQLSRIAHGNVLRNLFKEPAIARQYMQYYGQHTDSQIFTVSEKQENGKRIIEIPKEKEMLRLPNGVGIFSVRSLSTEKCSAVTFVRKILGTDWLLCGEDFEDVQTFAIKRNVIELDGAPDCMKEAEVTGIFSDENIDIPVDIAFDIFNLVIGQSLKVAGFPVDKHDNQNPNYKEIEARITNNPQA